MTTLLAILKENGRPYPDVTEERRLLRRAQNNHQSAIDALCATLYWSIIDIVARIVGDQTPEDTFDSLLSAGVEGALKAIQAYNLDSKARLRTYAIRYIRGEVMREMSRSFSHLSVPHNAVGEARKLLVGATPSDLKISNKKAESLIHANTPATDLDDYRDIPESMTDAQSDLAMLQSLVLEVLNPDEYFAVCMSYGVFGFAKLKRDEVAQKIGITPHQVSRLLEQATETLQERIDQIDPE